jgi:maltose O-acetyltransferase
MVKRPVSLPPEVEARIDRFVEAVDDRLSSNEETATVVQEVLARLHGDGQLYDRWQDGGALSSIERLRLDTYHPRSVMLKSDPWAEKDEEQFRESKPLRWLWTGFDASPMAHNVAVALPFRRMLANHLFAEAGDDLQLFHGITFPYGHNIEMGDNCVVHESVLLDDRGELSFGDRVSIADDAVVHSHGHDVVDQSDVSLYRTVVEDDVRIAADAMLAAGSHVERNAMVGTKAIVRGTVPAHHVAVGAPAESVKVKPGWESVADDTGRLPDDRSERRIEHSIAEGVERVDEFDRSLTPPDGDETTGD